MKVRSLAWSADSMDELPKLDFEEEWEVKSEDFITNGFQY